MGLQIPGAQARAWLEMLNCGIEIRLVMEYKADSTRRTQDSEESNSDALRWTISAWGSEAPFTVELDHVEQIKRAISITNDELSVIANVIRRNRIPNPMRAMIGRVDAPIDVDGPFRACAVSFDFAKHMSKPNAASNWLKRVDFNFRNRDRRDGLRKILENLSKTVDHGCILIVAEDFLYKVLVDFVRVMPRFVVLKSGYGSSDIIPEHSLRKPSRASIISWLCANSGRAEEVGAIALFGAGLFELDIGAIRDLLDVDIFSVQPAADQPYWNIDLLPPAQPISSTDFPRISIVTVSFNQATFLERTIESVLNQGYPNLEYVIVDGGSTDGSVQIIDRYREHFSSVVVEPDNGQSDALNKGFRLTSGEVLNWLCSDDLLEPGALHRVAQAYVTHKPDLIVGGCVRIAEEREIELARHHTAVLMGETIPLNPLDILRFMGSWQRGHYFFQPEVFFSRRIWDAAGGFLKPHLFYAMDYDLWLRMAFAGAKIRHIPSFLGCSRVHTAQKTQNNQHYLHQLAQIMNEYKELFERLSSTLGSRPVN
jgi:GT2 family glycosyltransferase